MFFNLVMSPFEIGSLSSVYSVDVDFCDKMLITDGFSWLRVLFI